MHDLTNIDHHVIISMHLMSINNGLQYVPAHLLDAGLEWYDTATSPYYNIVNNDKNDLLIRFFVVVISGH
jgi:hypothetical protein